MSGGGSRISRRQLLGGIGAAGLAAGAVGSAALVGREQEATDSPVAFRGPHQAGVATDRPPHVVFAAFDLLSPAAAALPDLMRKWTTSAEHLTAGLPVGPPGGDPLAPPGDTGEALGLPPARLTVTFGFGPAVFAGVLASRRPASLVDLPAFPNEALDPGRTGGDLCVQACANDPQVAFHAIRTLTRIARGQALLRWSQTAFLPQGAGHPRNLLGFTDGTNNLNTADPVAMAKFVWADAADDPAWMHGGTYMVVRRIRMRIEVWDRSSLDDQERTIGRHKVSGAPLGGTRETDPVNLVAMTDGEPAVPVDAHIRLAAAAAPGERLLRRSYSFSDGVDPALGQLDAGLFFVAFTRDPRRSFIPIQTRLAGLDALNEYIQHVGSAIFAIPPGAGAAPAGFVGDTLLA
jgi:deferrochelatase/peroxidase EfeB